MTNIAIALCFVMGALVALTAVALEATGRAHFTFWHWCVIALVVLALFSAKDVK